MTRNLAGKGSAAPRGGLTTKIHLAADLRCRPVARLTSPGQHGDSPRFIPLMNAVPIQRPGLGRPRSRPGRAMADKAYSSPATAPTCGSAASRRLSPSRKTRKPTAATVAAPAAGRRSLTTGGTRSATPSNAASASSSSSAPWPPATTSASASTKAPSTSPRSASGYATLSHDPRDTP